MLLHALKPAWRQGGIAIARNTERSHLAHPQTAQRRTSEGLQGPGSRASSLGLSPRLHPKPGDLKHL